MIDINYLRFAGLYNKDDFPDIKRLRSSLGLGAIYFSQADNVNINDAFKPERRDGFDLKDSGSYKSLWANDSIILAVNNGNLVRIIPDNSYTIFTKQILKNGVGNYEMDYTEAGYSKYIYFTNDAVIGYIENFIAYNLPTPTFTYKRVLPSGHIVEFYRGRIYIAVDNLVIYSDGVNFNHYDEREDMSFFKFSNKITMFRSVTDGIWVSDGKTIMFFNGLSPFKMTRQVVAGYGAIEGTAIKVKGKVINNVFYDNAVMFKAKDGHGICVGGNSGQFINLTDDRIITEDADIGTAIIRKGAIDQYIAITR